MNAHAVVRDGSNPEADPQNFPAPKNLSPLFNGNVISVVGISTGDEGKGRTVLDALHLLRQHPGVEDPVHMVVRVNGGANSGHTVAGLKHNLIPGGVTDLTIPYLALGRGVVADPLKLNWEMAPLEAAGYRVQKRLAIDRRTMFSDITDRILDLADESFRERETGERRGSTGRGISPSYQRETAHRQTFYEVFASDSYPQFRTRIAERIHHAERACRDMYELSPSEWFEILGKITRAEWRANRNSIESGLIKREDIDFRRYSRSAYELDIDAVSAAYWIAGLRIKDQVRDVGELALGIVKTGNYVIGEFGQAYWLDKRHGFPPNVTASHTYTPEIWQTLNIPTQIPTHVMGVAKAYDTKVGTHHFPTEIPHDHPLAMILRPIEFGTTTSRQRMVGWFDAVEKGQTMRRGGFDDLVINKIDQLTLKGDWQGPLKLCVGYTNSLDSRNVCYRTPHSNEERRSLLPVYQAFPGWSTDISGVRSFNDLPVNARNFVAAMYQSIIDAGTFGGYALPRLPVFRFLGVGPDPDQIISDIPSPSDLESIARRAGLKSPAERR